MIRIRQLFEKVLGDEAAGDPVPADDSVHAILDALDGLPRDQARYVATFAYVLGRAANADQETSAAETRRMRDILMRVGGLDEEVAAVAVQAATHRNVLFGSTDDFVVTREFRNLSTVHQRRELVDGAFAIVAADDSISGIEEVEVRKIASELGFTDPEYLAIRQKWNDKRDVLKNWPTSGNGPTEAVPDPED
jgi:uncharacterized tellurite resistance protein B-like protein